MSTQDVTNTPNQPNASEPEVRSLATRILDSDLLYSFKQSKVTMGAAFITLLFFMGALFAPVIAPHNPFDLASLNILDSYLPPAWVEGGDDRFLLRYRRSGA